MDANILNDNSNLLAGFYVVRKVTNSVRININSDNRNVHFVRVLPFAVPQFLGSVQHDYLGMLIMEQN